MLPLFCLMRQICDLVAALGQTLKSNVSTHETAEDHRSPLDPCRKAWEPVLESSPSSSSRLGCPEKMYLEVFSSSILMLSLHLHIIFVDINDVALQVVLELLQLSRFSCQSCYRLLRRACNLCISFPISILLINNTMTKLNV